MCQPQYFDEFRRAVSDSRLRPYLNYSSTGDEVQVLAVYLWNLALCESLYPALQGIEVALRNSINDAASAEFGEEFWFKSQLTGYEKKRIDEIDEKFTELKVQATPGRYIAECNFGFWVNLFSGKYEQILWRKLIKDVFPHMPAHLRKRKAIRSRLNNIRRLRNRVFHHEAVWHLPDLEQRHREIRETIGWISPAMAAMTEMLDRFSSVYTRGPQHYNDELDSIARNWAF